ncbi:RNA-binding domain-containing protein [Micromonospora sp. NPDC050795]|uniref:RNA-binding domain-containing protein n=1 Tax=Micromonospora sp. NPDC050795 TaxID=3364282 RepID=UPI0037AB005F
MDTTRRPVRPSEWLAVLDAVYNAEQSDEQTWLEWKSSLDLHSKEQMAKIVSKAIIAMANRDPNEAALTVGGIGILLIGIDPGSVAGVDQVDNADLDQMIANYIGSDGPVWQPHWTQYQGMQILLSKLIRHGGETRHTPFEKHVM